MAVCEEVLDPQADVVLEAEVGHDGTCREDGIKGRTVVTSSSLACDLFALQAHW